MANRLRPHLQEDRVDLWPVRIPVRPLCRCSRASDMLR
ncbi:MAG: hypothetical protein HSCHL_0465 [Hydrogenibacillus schlegelii]|uniref:Uncharacterized protein n=1 Tax=Hydrogenibacillus schlegelii TaxID=1484 RepID=A0A2T5G843_HYDSH|nr:MAG: hypothetical protein HSCHL_0465 [Hydrogenibacillus schlegelii]